MVSLLNLACIPRPGRGPTHSVNIVQVEHLQPAYCSVQPGRSAQIQAHAWPPKAESEHSCPVFSATRGEARAKGWTQKIKSESS